MSHLGDDELVLIHYGEGDALASAHARACADCRARLETLRRALGAVEPPPVPERSAGYGAEVWARIEPRLRGSGRGTVAVRSAYWRRTAGFAALAAALVAAFLLGRSFPGRPQPLSAEVRERILLVAVADHLERSQMVLVEIANAPADAPLDVSAQRVWADELASANRVYRLSAGRSREPGLTALLEELERVLVEVAAGPDRLAPADLRELQRRIESRGLLFKVRVIESQTRERGRETPPRAASVS
jgi:hypothetical protein